LIDPSIQYHLKKPSNVRKRDSNSLFRRNAFGEKPRSYQSTFLRKTKSRLSPIIQPNCLSGGQMKTVTLR